MSAVVSFPKQLEKALKEMNGSVDMATTMTQAYSTTDQELSEFEYEGCTATTIYVWEENGKRFLQSANVGDSAAYLFRGNEIIPLTKGKRTPNKFLLNLLDHKPSNPDERKRIIESGVELSSTQTRIGGLAVSRALGDHFLKQENTGVTGVPHTSPLIEVTSPSTLLLASDGVRA